MSDEATPRGEVPPEEQWDADKWDAVRAKWDADHGGHKTPREYAKTQIQSYFAIGILSLVIGVGIMIACWPSTKITPGYTSSFSDMLSTPPTVEKEGSAFGFFVGAVIGAIGQVLLAVAIIAAGVRIGSVQDD